MGKASKWIKNLLVGNKEEKNKKRDFSNDIVSAESSMNSKNSILVKEKRVWSFRKSTTSQNDFVFRSMKSFDSMINSQKLAKELIRNSENEQVGIIKAIIPPKQSPAEHGAATKIQAVFRSYLARRALRALRALVKLQALARGHLVRKRTTATMRCMHALVSIQVRARVQRMNLSNESQSSRHEQISKRYHAPQHFSQRLPNSEQGLYIRTSSSLSNLSTRQDSPRANRTKQNVSATFSGPQLEYDHLVPNYMANTKSSRAKARSHSEPKQRPKKIVKQRDRRSASNDRLDFDLDNLAPSLSNLRVKNQKPWLARLYQSAKGVAKESGYDSTSVTTDSSNTSRSIMAYETPVVLY